MLLLYLIINNHTLHISKKNKDTIVKSICLDMQDTINYAFVDKIKRIIRDFSDFDGGVVYQDIPSKHWYYIEDDKVFDILQILMEEFNRPFISLMDKEDNIEELIYQAEQRQIWNVKYVGYNPGKDEYARESLLTIGNGFMGLRGTIPEMKISNQHYPATYIAGVYNIAKSKVDDAIICNEDFVNVPNMQYFSIKVDDQLMDVTPESIKYMKRNLNLRNGLFTSKVVHHFSNGKKVSIRCYRIVNMNSIHEYVLKYSIEPINFSGQIEIISEGDGTVYNYNVERYRGLESHHMEILNTSYKDNKAMIVSKTKQSNIVVVQKSALIGYVINTQTMDNTIQENVIRQTIKVDAVQGKQVEIEKFVYIEKYTNSDWKKVGLQFEIKTFDQVLSESELEWQRLWKQAHISISGDMMASKLLNLHTYHMLVSGSPKGNKNADISVTARGLHGEAYRGHIFWDELFVMPFYNMYFPKTARDLLMYRYNRLRMAKKEATKSGYKGAMYPWQSGLDGSEQTQGLHLNPLNGKWGPDHSKLQRHVSLAVIYNVWLYWNMTQDIDFLKQYGAEMIIEVALFWQSATKYDENTKRYFIDKVMGPDEFHEVYPNKKEGGLKNNAYTNVMVSWLFSFVNELKTMLDKDTFKEIMHKTNCTNHNLLEMQKIGNRLSLEIDNDGVIAQYEGYFKLKEIDWNHYKEKYTDIHRMDRILRAEDKSADDYKVAKQADTLMLFYNFSRDKIDTLIKSMNYHLPEHYLNTNLEYYMARTSHGSTLSRVVHAKLAAMIGDRQLSWKLYKEALYSDYNDIQGGTTAEGIHTGVMAATIYITLNMYAGIDISGNILTVQPNLPDHWKTITFNINFRSVQYHFTITHDVATIMATKDTIISMNDSSIDLTKNCKKEIFYKRL